MTLTIIVATGSDRAIGRAGDLAFHISADLKHFKALTMGHPVIMGRKTFESLPKGALPGRRNIVITRNADYSAPNIEIAPSLDAAITMVADVDEAFIIGGGTIYEQAMPLADCLQLTVIDATDPDADTFFPEINSLDWVVTDQTSPTTDDKTGLSYIFQTLKRKRQ